MKYEQLGQHIFAARKRHGWDQAQLVRLLAGEVGQQTVSRWERGQSRPVRSMVVKLAAVLQVDVQDLLNEAGYTALSDQSDAMPLPVRPQLTTLPVAALSPENFEAFVTDVAQQLNPKADVSRLGSQGHKQYGVDIVAKGGTKYLATWQCKRHKQFGAAKVHEAVAKVELEANHHYLVLSRQSASPEARKAINDYPGWTLWDADDLTRIIRTQISREVALRIVDTYFPRWREPLLGIAEPGPWLRPDEANHPFTQYYTQDWQLVGRADDLREIETFLDGPAQVGILSGRGGIGKTRLLLEVARNAERRGLPVRFLKPGDLEPQHLELLPEDDHLVVIIDDAHDRDNLTADIGELLRWRRPLKLLLGIRPYGIEPLRSDLARLGIRLSDLPQRELTDLPRGDAQALARQALGPDWPDIVVERLGTITADCPFITVVAGVLIREGKLDPNCLDHEETIRKEALTKFTDAIVADPSGEDPRLRREVLEALAALQPFRTDDPDFQGSLANLVGLPYDRVVRHLRALEDAGVLLRRGQSLRIVPDLLGDVILTNACFDDRSNTSTGYLERAWKATSDQALRHLFVNATRVDWQVRHDAAGAPPLTSALWGAIEQSLESGGIITRLSIVQLLAKVAFFAPEQSLQTVKWVIDNPTEVVEDSGQLVFKLYPPSYRNVLEALPPVLRSIAYNLQYLSEAAEALWQLAQLDHRPTNPFPDHPLRVLTGLAEFDPGKPLPFNEAIVDAAERWLQTTSPDAGNGPSPFHVLEPILATEGTTNRTDGLQIQFRTFTINEDVVRPLRRRVVHLALQELPSEDAKRALRALEFIQDGLRYPAGYFGRDVPDQVRETWTDNFVEIIEELDQALQQPSLDPLITVAARRTVQWHAHYSNTATRAAARSLLSHLPDTLEHRLALVLFDGWGQLLTERDSDWRKAEAEQDALMDSVVGELLSTYDDSELVHLLLLRLQVQALTRGAGSANPAPLISKLVRARPSLGQAMCSLASVDPGCSFAPTLPIILATLAESPTGGAIASAQRLLDTGDLGLRRSVAQGLGWNRGTRATLLAGELQMLHLLAADKDQVIRVGVIAAAQRLAKGSPTEALGLLSTVPFGDSTEVAEEMMQSFTDGGAFSWDQLNEQQREVILQQLVECPSLGPYWITRFLAKCSQTEPEQILGLLMDRVERWEQTDGATPYDPLPLEWDLSFQMGTHLPQVRGHKNFPKLLRVVRDWMAQSAESWKRLDAGGHLFSAIAGTYDDTVLEVLDEGLLSGDANQLAAVAAILRRAPNDFAFDRPDFVSRVLQAAKKRGKRRLQDMAGALQAATISGSRTGTPGQPFSRDVAIRTRAKENADAQQAGSVEEQFYRSLEKSAIETIEWHKDRDAQLLDGRDW